MKRKTVISIVSVLVIALMIFLSIYLNAYALELRREFDINFQMVFMMTIRPLLFLVIGCMLGLLIRQFVATNGHKVVFITVIIITIVLFILAFVFNIPNIYYMIFQQELNISTGQFYFGVLGVGFLDFLLKYAAYLYIPLGLIILISFPKRNKKLS